MLTVTRMVKAIAQPIGNSVKEASAAAPSTRTLTDNLAAGTANTDLGAANMFHKAMAAAGVPSPRSTLGTRPEPARNPQALRARIAANSTRKATGVGAQYYIKRC